MNPLPLLFGTPWPWWLIVFAGGLAGWLTWAGYRRRAAEVKPGMLRILKTLRFTAWFLLFACLLQPVYRQLIREEKASRLTVLVDDSESMGFTDTREGPTRQQTVLKALMGSSAAKKPKAGEAVPAPDRDALLGVLSQHFKVQLESFSAGTRVLQHPAELKAGGEASDIAKALTDSFARLKGPDAGGLVLISDGADTAHGEIDRITAAYKRAGTPVYALGVGRSDQQDLAVSQIRCRRTVSKDTLVRVEVDVAAQGLDANGKHKVSILRNGKEVGEAKTIELKGNVGSAVFEFLPEQQGFLEYEAKVEPFAGELVTANNTMAFGLMAFSRKMKVLYMEGSMFQHKIYQSESTGMYFGHPMQNWWEHEFLERSLMEELDVQIDVLAKSEFATPRGASPLTLRTVKEGYPKTKKELYQYDVIVCADIPYSAFNDDQIQSTVDFVYKHGGGFVMIGGYDSFAEGKYAKTPVDKMLPVEMLDEIHQDRINFNWAITDEGWTHPIMQLEKDAEKNREAWKRLPGFHGFSRTTRPKPGATTLAVVADEEQFGTIYGPAVLAAVQQFGKGRSMAFTTDSTGSWGTEWEDTWGPAGSENDLMTRNQYFKTFWKNTIRWLAEYRMKAPNQLVTIETDRLVYGRGEEPDVRVRVMNEDYEPTHDAKVMLSIIRPDGTTQALTMFPRYEEPGLYERKLEAGQVGRYELEVTATLRSEELGKDKALLQVRPATAEMKQLAQNTALLQKIADQTGGVYLPIENASKLPEHLRDATHVIEKHRDEDIWDKPMIFAIIIALLCGEWFLRKRNGLP